MAELKFYTNLVQDLKFKLKKHIVVNLKILSKRETLGQVRSSVFERTILTESIVSLMETQLQCLVSLTFNNSHRFQLLDLSIKL